MLAVGGDGGLQADNKSHAVMGKLELEVGQLETRRLFALDTNMTRGGPVRKILPWGDKAVLPETRANIVV